MTRPFDSSFVSWLKPDTTPQLRAVVHRAVGDDEFYFANVVDGFQRIAVENDHIGSLARFHCADVLVEPHHAGWHNRCGLNRFHRRESGLDVELDFAVQAVPRNRLTRSAP